MISKWTGWTLLESDRFLGGFDRHLKLTEARRHSILPPDYFDAALVAGLDRRIGRYLIPPAVVSPDGAYEAALYGVMLRLIRYSRGLDPDGRDPVEVLGGPSVCRGCTAVFRPRRKSGVTYCRQCGHGPPAGGILGLVPEDGLVRVPSGDLLNPRWRSAWFTRCAECGRQVLKDRRRDPATFCCRACKARDNRRA